MNGSQNKYGYYPCPSPHSKTSMGIILVRPLIPKPVPVFASFQNQYRYYPCPSLHSKTSTGIIHVRPLIPKPVRVFCLVRPLIPKPVPVFAYGTRWLAKSAPLFISVSHQSRPVAQTQLGRSGKTHTLGPSGKRRGPCLREVRARGVELQLRRDRVRDLRVLQLCARHVATAHATVGERERGGERVTGEERGR